jgi:hypothetical protein
MDKKIIPVGNKKNYGTTTRETNKKIERQSGRCKNESMKKDDTSTYGNLQKNEEGFVTRKPTQFDLHE